MDENSIVVVDMQKPGAREHLQMCQIIGALGIQAKTGMTHSQGSVIKLARHLYGIKGRTAEKAESQVRAIYLARYGREYGSK